MRSTSARDKPEDKAILVSRLVFMGLFRGLPPAGKCTCRLIRPGIKYLPVRSTTRSPLLGVILPICAILSFSIATSVPGRGDICSVPSSSVQF